MRELRHAVSIRARPEEIWDWLTHLAENYRAWHPDHLGAEWERGEPNRTGSILRAVEDLDGRRETLRFELTRIDPPHRFEYRLRGPISIMLPHGAFTVISEDGASRFVATIAYRFGWFTEHLFKRRHAALRAHMNEEGENLRRIIESSR